MIALRARRNVRTALATVAFGLIVSGADNALSACTAFCAAAKDGTVLVGNNEDWFNPRTKIHFIPATPGTYGRLYVGFDDLYPQGGMNDRGLWFDGFATPPVRPDATLPSYAGNIVDDAMAKCATVEEVVRLFSQYNRTFLKEAVLMFADASGDAASIEANAIVRKKAPHFVQTNFRQSRRSAKPDERFTIATSMLDHATDVSLELFRDILAATHQEGPAPTQYSNVYDLRSRTMYLYFFHDYNHGVTIRLDEELKKGERVVDIPSLFPRNASAEQFAAKPRQQDGALSPVAVLTGTLVVGVAVLGLALHAFIRASRGARLLVAGAAAALVGTVGLGVFTLNSAKKSDVPWLEFSIAPPSGRSASIQPTMLRGDGVTLIAALSTAYDIPAIRISGPDWLRTTRYSITAVADADEAPLFRSYLKKELEQRLQLTTHVEPREYDVFVLRASGALRLQAAPRRPSIWVRDDGMELVGASMADLASVLQGVLEKPIEDETGISGSYNMQIAWGADRTSTLTAELRDRFGLELTADRRTMDTLIVDDIRPEASLVLLGHIGRATAAAPARVREQLARILALH